MFRVIVQLLLSSHDVELSGPGGSKGPHHSAPSALLDSFMLVSSSTADLVLHDPLKQLNLRFLSPLNIFPFLPRCHLANFRSAGMFFLASSSFLCSPHTMICVCYSYKGTLTSMNDSFQFLIILQLCFFRARKSMVATELNHPPTEYRKSETTS